MIPRITPEIKPQAWVPIVETRNRRQLWIGGDCPTSYTRRICVSSVANTSTKSNSSNKLPLTSGEKVKRRKYSPPPPPAPVLNISKLVSLAMTLEAYEIAPNAATVRKIGGNHE